MWPASLLLLPPCLSGCCWVFPAVMGYIPVKRQNKKSLSLFSRYCQHVLLQQQESSWETYFTCRWVWRRLGQSESVLWNQIQTGLLHTEPQPFNLQFFLIRESVPYCAFFLQQIKLNYESSENLVLINYCFIDLWYLQLVLVTTELNLQFWKYPKYSIWEIFLGFRGTWLCR